MPTTGFSPFPSHTIIINVFNTLLISVSDWPRSVTLVCCITVDTMWTPF